MQLMALVALEAVVLFTKIIYKHLGLYLSFFYHLQIILLHSPISLESNTAVIYALKHHWGDPAFLSFLIHDPLRQKKSEFPICVEFGFPRPSHFALLTPLNAFLYLHCRLLFTSPSKGPRHQRSF